MPIDAVCPAGHRMIAGDHRAGQTVHCPICSVPVELPVATSVLGLEPGLGETRKLTGEIPEVGLAAPQGEVSYSFEVSDGTPAELRRRGQQVEDARPPKLLTSQTILVAKATDVVMPPHGQKTSPETAEPKLSLIPARRDRAVAARLAMTITGVTLLSLVPIVVSGHWHLGVAPNWARIVMLMAMLQFAYGIWMWRVPDWSTVWVAMVVFAVVAAVYALGLVVSSIELNIHAAQTLGLDSVSSAGAWCVLMLLVSTSVTVACARTAYALHKRGMLVRSVPQ